MPVVIKTKNAAAGTPASLEVGELAVNTTDGKLFVGSAVGGVITLSDNLLPLDNTWTGTNTFTGGATLVTGTINGTTIGASAASTGKFTTLEATQAVTFVTGTINGTTIGASTASTGKFTTLEATTNSLIGDTLQINTGQLGPIGLAFPNLTIQNDVSVVGGYVANSEVLKANIQLGVAIPAIQFGNVINDSTVLSDKAGLIGLNTHLISNGGDGSLTPNAVVDEMVLLGANTGLYSRANLFAVPTKRIFLSANGTITIAGGAQVNETGLPAVATACSTVYGSNGSITTTTPLNTMTTNATTGDWKVTHTQANSGLNASIELAQGAVPNNTNIIFRPAVFGFTINEGRLLLKRQTSSTTPTTSGGQINFADYSGTNTGFILRSFGASTTPDIEFITPFSPFNGVKLVSGAQSWSSISDERVKNITGTVEDATTLLSNLRTVYYTMKEDPSNVEQVGLIAQDVQAVLPCAVNKRSEDDDTLSLRYTDVIPVLVKAIQELTARVEALEA